VQEHFAETELKIRYCTNANLVLVDTVADSNIHNLSRSLRTKPKTHLSSPVPCSNTDFYVYSFMYN